MLTSLDAVIQKLESGSRPKGGVKNSSIGIPSLGAEHLDDIGGFKFKKIKYIPEHFFNSQKKGVIEKDDILIVKDGATTGKVSFVGGDFSYKKASINEHLFKIAVNKKYAISKYVFWHLFSAMGLKQVLKDFRGATVGGISRGFAKNVLFPLPSLKEQGRIVEVLDQADSLRQKRKQSLDLLDEYLKSVFLKMFGDPVSNTKKWEVKLLGDLLKKMTSGSRGWAKYYSDSGSIFLTIKNVGRNNKLLLDDITYVNAPDNAESRRTKVQNGDVLLSITADLGRTAVVDNISSDAYINQHLAILRLKDNCRPRYISQFISSNGGQLQIQKLNRGASKAGLNFNDIKSIRILVPPLELQNKFSEIVQGTKLVKQKMLTQSGELDIQFQALMQGCFKQD